jgi:Zn-dependent membrane protease YugP
VLKAAALTYIVALALAIVQFLNLLGMNRRR